MKTTRYIKSNNGFTLVEISIVLVIFGLIIGGLLGPVKIQLDNMNIKETERSIRTSKEAIIGFAIRNGRIPCPDTNNDGQEDMSGSNCSSTRGLIPWVTLGVNQTDAWHQPFTYRVDAQFADTSDGSGCADPDVPGISFEMCSNGNISVFNSSGGTLVASGIPAIIVSHGKNWTAAGDTDEQENTDNDANFVDRHHINNGYDDLIGWINVNNLIGSMVSANKIP